MRNTPVAAPSAPAPAHTPARARALVVVGWYSIAPEVSAANDRLVWPEKNE